jgi:DNA-binding transcriptional ArsR family regulator
MRTVDISLGAVDRAGLLVCEGPGATVLTSVVELFGKLGGRLPRALQTFASSRVGQIDLAPLALLRSGEVLPAALFPSTGSARTTFAEELDRISANAELVAEQINVDHPERPPAVFHEWLRRPQAAMGAYLDALGRYHDVVVRDLYPNLPDRLAREADVYRRVIDGEGLSFLGRLHAKLRGHAGGLRYVERHKTGRLRLAPTQVSFIPMVCAPQTVTTNLYGAFDPSVLQFCFASPNLAVADAAARTAQRPADPLAALVGATRARVVRELVVGASTTDLASQLRLSPATVSHHLSVLAASGTATAHRSGPSVYYRLTDRGHTLLRLYGDPP